MGISIATRINKKTKKRSTIVLFGFVAGLSLLLGGYWATSKVTSRPTEAPEAQKVLDAQSDMPFQILIPAYLPKPFDRPGMEIQVNQTGPGGEPMVQLTYRNKKGAVLFFREWVPINPDMEILAGSRPIQTRWGRGWLLRQGEGLIAIWIDVGPLRVSIYTPNQKELSQEQLLAIADNMGPASNRQVFTFLLEPPQIRAVEPPPPVEIETNAEGIQEVDLIITPGGYSPLRFAVRKDLPVRLNFRQLGQVGCGNELNFPTAVGGEIVSLKLASPSDRQVLDFTPKLVGKYEFYCGHYMFRGEMTVHE